MPTGLNRMASKSYMIKTNDKKYYLNGNLYIAAFERQQENHI